MIFPRLPWKSLAASCSRLAREAGGIVSLPLQVSFSSIDKSSESSIFLHELNKSLFNLKFSCRNSAFSTGRKSNSSFLVSFNSLSSSCGLLTDISREHNQIVIFLDIVHDFGLQEGLSS